MKLWKILVGVAVLGGLSLTAVPALADVWCNESLRPPQGYSAGDLEKTLLGRHQVLDRLMGGFSNFNTFYDALTDTTLLQWDGGRVSSNDGAQWYCYQIAGNVQVYPTTITWTHLKPEPRPILVEIPAVSFMYEFFTDGEMDYYYGIFMHTVSDRLPLRMTNLRVGYVPNPLKIAQVTEEGFNQAGVVWLGQQREMIIGPYGYVDFFAPLPAGAALVYQVELTFEPNHPRVFPSIQAGQAFEQR